MNEPVIDSDAIVIGMGPVGLYQIFQLGLQGMRVQAFDSLPEVGGQCQALYPDRAIHDIPGFRSITGQQLCAQLLAQIQPFYPRLHLGQTIVSLAPLDDGRFELRTDTGQQARAPVVVLAAGAGAYQRRPLALPGAERHRGRQLFEQPMPAQDFRGKRVVVLGGGNEALQQCLDLIRQEADVTLVYRRARFSHYATDPALIRAIDEQTAVGRLRRETGQPLRLIEDASQAQMQALVIVDAEDGHEIELPLDALLVCHGLTPTLAPLQDWGIPVEGRHVPVDPASCATVVPGLLAVGDLCTYPGKLKLIVSGFHEATLAAHTAAGYVQGRRVPLEYTAVSLRHQRRLGVLTEEKLAARLRPHVQLTDGI